MCKPWMTGPFRMGYFISDFGRAGLVGYVNAAVILYVTAITDFNPVNIAPNGAVKPDTGLIAQGYIADNVGTRSDEIGFVKAGFFVEEFVNHGKKNDDLSYAK